jgi:glycosyltransferase involved in cell wall biosynthesis
VTLWSAISFLWRRYRMQRSLLKALSDMVEDRRPDAIVMLSLTEKLLLTEWATNHGICVVWVEHDRIGRWLRCNPWLPTLRRLARLASVVCVSELSAELYRGLGFPPESIVAIPNGVPAAKRRERREQREASSVLHLGCIARLSLEKGIDTLISALDYLPEATLRIIGRGPQEYALRQMIAADNERMVRTRITLENDHPDLDAFYASIDVLVLPSSDHDPFGLTAAEAMVRGIPVVVTDACGIAGYLEDGKDALIVPAGDIAALAKALHRLLNCTLRTSVGECGMQKALERFSVDEMIGAYERLISAGFARGGRMVTS